MIKRGQVTDVVFGWLNATDYPIGDNIAPYEGGWPNGVPNVGEYAPYVVLSGGIVSDVAGALCSDSSEYRLTYMLGIFAATRVSLDRVADAIRPVFLGHRHELIDGYQITQCGVKSYGRIVRNDGTDPPLWSEADTVVLECAPFRQ